VLIHLRHGDIFDQGYNFICHILHDFEHVGPNGTHYCFVFELMGETLQSFKSWFGDERIPNPVMRSITAQLLLALNYAHMHDIIHTGMFRVISETVL